MKTVLDVKVETRDDHCVVSVERDTFEVFIDQICGVRNNGVPVLIRNEDLLKLFGVAQDKLLSVMTSSERSSYQVIKSKLECKSSDKGLRWIYHDEFKCLTTTRLLRDMKVGEKL